MIERELVDQFRISLFDSREEKEFEQRKLITLEEIGSIGRKRRSVEPVIYLEEELYADFLASRRDQMN